MCFQDWLFCHVESVFIQNPQLSLCPQNVSNGISHGFWPAAVHNPERFQCHVIEVKTQPEIWAGEFAGLICIYIYAHTYVGISINEQWKAQKTILIILSLYCLSLNECAILAGQNFAPPCISAPRHGEE